ncbi:acyl carrier protein [Burkholderia gladioli]|jgi:polyketide biosynthesis acyl carrier protein|uniref:Acyl carrier protein n=1 Tax=Burkholderia gladioli TaxID=28095 RepID=A0AAP1UXC0_BURGA|nr:acyl carrier protein [Burkholderia gladioli]AJW94424.1 polyketide biosynthesis acyl-carrier-protein AcpK [Burkholderia gladioli]ASD82649.1 acyl carrier protein [Burkholderia gladioli pv. gladioli]AWY50089.1 acyl carrier protein [Burkholderia gladioli pv. gladioli]KAF1059885.1 Polyketide biosynthesis acyl-carrier-protein AcpK [Burkholderia gladioli]KGC14663.1 polyketide biosynthesis acyl-carrier-protein AcpK [Burkholderia gladioli]
MNRDAIFDVLVGHTREILPELGDRQIRSEDRLADLGANSVDRAEIVMLTLESLSLRLPLVETSGPNNLGELADLLHARLQHA